ncbi:MAG: hypothetical protein KC668_12220 [Myxococcales bacterium]|nr:hypothetical protein [Myxococcales bacterium]
MTTTPFTLTIRWTVCLAAACLALPACDQLVVVGRVESDAGEDASPDDGVDGATDGGEDGGDDHGVDGGTTCQEALVADSLAVGTYHVCARRGGAVWCWGGGQSGQLCNGDTPESALPGPPVGVDTYQEVYVGGLNTCLSRVDGALLCCGNNFSGALADGTSQNQSRPQAVTSDVEDVVIGFSNVYATDGDGDLFAWGDNEYGQLGLGPATAGEAVRTIMAVSGVSFAQVSANTHHACGVTSGGELRCAGANDGGELGIPLSPGVDVFTVVPAAVSFRSVSAGRRLGCAISTGNQLYCWGTNEPTMVTGVTGFVEMPTRVGTLNDYESVSVGFDHLCVLRDGGRLFCWGSGENGKLGYDAVTRDTPTEVTPGVAYRVVRAGPDFTCAIRATDDVVVCFGDDSVGQTAGSGGGATPRPVCLTP